MSLGGIFGGRSSNKETVAPPSIDEAQQRIDAMRRGAALKGRAANMLAQSNAAPTAQRQVTGN